MKPSLLTTLIAASLLASTAAAQSDSGHPAHGRSEPAPRPLIGGHGNNITAFIAQHDGNDDGRLTWAEFDAFRRARFDETDGDGDGTVDEDEYVQEYQDRLRLSLEQERAGLLEQTEVRFAALDADKDGSVSRTEFDASGERVYASGVRLLAEQPAEPKEGEARTDANAARFDRAGRREILPTSHTREGFLELYDANGDGEVPRAEFDQVRAAQFARTDANGDGRLGKDEYLAEFEERLDRRIAVQVEGSDKQTRVRFGALDADKDGKLTFAEYQLSGRRTFDRADRNGDGVVDAEDAKLPPAPEGARERQPAAQP